MIPLLLKGLVSGALVVGIFELAKRYSLLAAVLASLPITSILAFIWLYYEQRDTQAIATLALDIVWLVIPSLAFFFALSFLLTAKYHFWLSLLLSGVLTAACYAITLQVKQWIQ
jgi:hypothetical protein